MIKEIVIDTEYKNQILNKLYAIGFTNFLDKNRNNYAELCSIIDGKLRDLMISYAQQPLSMPAVVVRGLPTDQYLPDTPFYTGDIISKPLLTELVLLSVVNNLGVPIGFKSEYNGAIIHNISPKIESSDTKSSSGAKEPMGMHSDFAFSDNRPEWLILMCLRNNDNIPTRVAIVNEICKQLTLEEVEVLKSQKFKIFPPDSSLVVEPRIDSILSVVDNNFISRFNKDKCIGTDNISNAVLNKFAAIAEDKGIDILLEPGDVLIFNNKLMLHSRKSFEARYDGSDRWLQRVYCKSKNEMSSHELTIFNDVSANEVA